jgi:hypothetical protein
MDTDPDFVPYSSGRLRAELTVLVECQRTEFFTREWNDRKTVVVHRCEFNTRLNPASRDTAQEIQSDSSLECSNPIPTLHSLLNPTNFSVYFSALANYE